jgi:hypothetical protein
MPDMPSWVFPAIGLTCGAAVAWGILRATVAGMAKDFVDLKKELLDLRSLITTVATIQANFIAMQNEIRSTRDAVKALDEDFRNHDKSCARHRAFVQARIGRLEDEAGYTPTPEGEY